jgi:hypothetical protein
MGVRDDRLHAGDRRPDPSRSDSRGRAAAVIFVEAFRQLGHDFVLVSDSIWDLTSLNDVEALSFAQQVVSAILDRHNLKLI